eukprot:PhM_4_TR10769/c0_g1_i1/m.24656
MNHPLRFLFLVVIFIATLATVKGEAAQSVDESEREVPAALPSNVAVWTIDDVARWARTVLRYPNVADAFAEHGVDGITLLALTCTDFDALNVSHPVHRTKIRAHLDVLRGECLCSKYTPDVWRHIGQSSNMWLAAMGSMLAPRLVGFYAGRGVEAPLPAETVAVATHEAYVSGDVEVEAVEGYASFLLGWAGILLWPHLYYAWLALQWFSTNYFVVPIYILSQALSQLQEYRILYKFAGDRQSWNVVLIHEGIPLGITVLLWVLSYVMPRVLESFILMAYLLFLLVQMVSVVVTLAQWVFGGDAPNKDREAQHQPDRDHAE